MKQAYVEQKFALDAFWGFLLEEDVADRVDDEYLAVLSDNALLDALGAQCPFWLPGHACVVGAWLAGRHDLFPLLLVFFFHGALFAAVARYQFRGGLVGGVIWAVVEQLGVTSGRGIDSGNAGDGRLVTPGRLASLANVTLDKVLAAAPSHEQGKVVETAAKDKQQADDDRAKAGAEALVVVA